MKKHQTSKPTPATSKFVRDNKVERERVQRTAPDNLSFQINVTLPDDGLRLTSERPKTRFTAALARAKGKKVTATPHPFGFNLIFARRRRRFGRTAIQFAIPSGNKKKWFINARGVSSSQTAPGQHTVCNKSYRTKAKLGGKGKPVKPCKTC